jgi:hypothetical protein
MDNENLTVLRVVICKTTRLVLRSTDGKNLKSSRNIQMYVAFGDRPNKWNGRAVTIKP